jgi:hypothetical protein
LNHPSVLRRILLLLCLLGAQHTALAHAYEHDATRSLRPIAEASHGTGLHTLVCADCLSAHSLGAAALPCPEPGLRHGTLNHVLATAAATAADACHLPEQHAHGPPSRPVT